MNIVIDQGNSSAKIALFKKDQLEEVFCFYTLEELDLLNIIERFSPQRGILSVVGDMNPSLVSLLKTKIPNFIELDEATKLPIQIEYKTPKTLGRDRIAAVVGAYTQKRNRNLLIIDMGTAITYDFLDSNGIYKGGNISPGMTTRFNALHQFTKKLPLLDENGDVPKIGYDTETAIRSGVINGIVREIESYMDEYEKKQDVLTFLTGGHAIYFANKFKKRIFADGNLVLKGLNEILKYQYV